jgi:hypothetical protein
MEEGDKWGLAMGSSGGNIYVDVLMDTSLLTLLILRQTIATG